jgi:hypothetical protein
VLLFGYFLLHEQEKVTRSPDASGNAQDASTILRSGQPTVREALLRKLPAPRSGT